MDKFNIKFAKIVIDGTIEEQFKAVKNELFYDCSDTIKLLREKDKKKEVEKLLFFISKYSFFLSYFEKKEEYIVCGEIQRDVKVLVAMFGYSEERIDELINNTMNSYKERLDWEKMFEEE